MPCSASWAIRPSPGPNPTFNPIRKSSTINTNPTLPLSDLGPCPNLTLSPALPKASCKPLVVEDLVHLISMVLVAIWLFSKFKFALAFVAEAHQNSSPSPSPSSGPYINPQR